MLYQVFIQNFKVRFFALLLIPLIMSFGTQAHAEISAEAAATASKLAGAKLNKVAPILADLEEQGGIELLPLFEGMLDGRLYYVKSDKTLVVVGDESDGIYPAVNALTGETLEPVGKKTVKKIKVNNRLRKTLRKTIARLTLFSDDVKLRAQAVDNLFKDLNAENIALLQEAKEKETSEDILEKINVALTLSELDSQSGEDQIISISKLADSLEPAVRNRLEQFVQKDDDGKYIETDKAVIAAAEKALSNIQSKLEFYGFIERLFFGLSLGSVLLLAAIGLSITFGVMGVINMAHGELLMLGAYTTYVIQLVMPNAITASIFVAIPAAFIVCGLVGVLIERGVIQFLKGRPLETLLATFGISLILQQTVRSIFSPLNRQVSTPEFMSGTLQINPGLALTYNRLYIIIFSLIVFACLLLVMKRTSLGLYVRAVSQNRNMAKAVGIRSEWVDAATFGLGSGIAGVAGVALSQLTNVGPNLGQSYIIDSFMVVVFGGVGNLWGTLVGAFSLGIVSKFMEPVTGTVLAQILVLIFIVLFIQRRPKGLFPQQGRAADE